MPRGSVQSWRSWGRSTRVALRDLKPGSSCIF